MEAPLDAPSRESFLIGDGDDEMTLDDLLSWIREFASEEAPLVIEEGGKIGVAALIPTLQEFSNLVKVNDWIAQDQRLDEDNVKFALFSLRDILAKALELAKRIAPTSGTP